MCTIALINNLNTVELVNTHLDRTRCPLVKYPANFPYLNTQEDKRRKEEREITVN